MIKIKALFVAVAAFTAFSFISCTQVTDDTVDAEEVISYININLSTSMASLDVSVNDTKESTDSTGKLISVPVGKPVHFCFIAFDNTYNADYTFNDSDTAIVIKCKFDNSIRKCFIFNANRNPSEYYFVKQD